MRNYTNQFIRVFAIAVCVVAAGTMSCRSTDYGSSRHHLTACEDDVDREFGDCDGSGGGGDDDDDDDDDGEYGDPEYGDCEYGSSEYGCNDDDDDDDDDDNDDDCEYGSGEYGCDDDCEYGSAEYGCDDDCTPITTTLADLISGLTELGCSTPPEVLDAILAELQRLLTVVDCSGDLSGYCEDDLEALVALITQLQALPIAFDCPSEIQDRLDAIIFASGRLAACGDTEIDNDDDDDGDDDDDNPVCAPVDWDRLSPAPNVGGNCSVIAMTSSTGYWDSVADIDPFAYRPGASGTSFSMWERSFNDYGWPLHPASELLSKFGLSTSQIGFMQAIPGTHQLFAALDLRPHQFQLMTAPKIVVVYGRTNASAAYVDEGELPLNLDPGAYSEYLYLLDYEHATKRDSIKVLTCDASELIGKRALTFSSRFAIDQPWIPYVPAQPGIWAAVLSCQASTSKPPIMTFFKHGGTP